MSKVCKKCRMEKSLDNYYSQKYMRKDGSVRVTYQPKCKECLAKEYQENKKERNKYNKEYKRKYPHRSRDAVRRYRERNYEKRQEDLKKWQQRNRDKLKEYNRYRQQHKNHEITDEEWSICLDYFNNQCAYCGMDEEIAIQEYGQRLHKEHVNHEGSNLIDNNIPSCKGCNSSKWVYSLAEWYTPEKEFYSDERLEKIHKWLNGDWKITQK